MPHDLSHSHIQLLGFQINPLSHIPFSHLHLSSFHLCLLLQTAAVNLHMHLQISCHIICLVSVILNIKLNALTLMFLIMSGTHNFEYVSLILLQLPSTTFIYFNIESIEHRLISIIIDHF